MEISKDNRGFSYIEFEDVYENECVLQQSSAIGNYEDSLSRPGSSMIWLGVNKPKCRIMDKNGWEDYKIPDEVSIHSCMHLNREDVKALINHLNNWLKTGKF